METLWRLMAVLSGALFTAGAVIPTPPETPVRDSLPYIQAPQEASNSVSGPSIPKYPTVPAWAECPELWATALQAGWAWVHLEKLDYLMWRESRCVPTAFNSKDPNGGSLGLLQINFFWCKPNRYTKQGFLQDKEVLSECSSLADPAANLKAALTIYRNSGWGPWGN